MFENDAFTKTGNNSNVSGRSVGAGRIVIRFIPESELERTHAAEDVDPDGAKLIGAAAQKLPRLTEGEAP